MDQVDTLHVARYMNWFEVLCCTHLRDLEVKVMVHDLVAKHKSGELRCPVTAHIEICLKI